MTSFASGLINADSYYSKTEFGTMIIIVLTFTVGQIGKVK